MNDRLYDEEKVFDHCALCGRPIYEGEDYYYINGLSHCEDCIDGAKREAFSWEQ